MTVDEYLKTIEPAKRKALQRIRLIAKNAVPDCEETISYSMPTLKYRGKPFLGFDAHRNHIGLYPYSSQPVTLLKERLSRYTLTKGAIRVPVEEPIPERLLRAVIACRLKAIREQLKERA